MTVAELIAQLVELDKSMYVVDVRCPHDLEADMADHRLLGVLAVIDGGPRAPEGWVTLEVDGDA